jgi:hypothetical protein
MPHQLPYPGLISGIFGIPKHICAKALMQAASSFFKKYSMKSTLRRIVFIDVDSSTIQAMKESTAGCVHGK